MKDYTGSQEIENKFNYQNLLSNIRNSYEHDLRVEKGEEISEEDQIINSINYISDKIYEDNVLLLGGRKGEINNLEKALKDNSFGDDLYKTRAEKHCTDLREKLKPYIFGAFENSIFEGLSQIRGLYVDNLHEEYKESLEDFSEDNFVSGIDSVIELLDNDEGADNEGIHDEVMDLYGFIVPKGSYVTKNVDNPEIGEEIKKIYNNVYEYAMDYGYESGIVGIGDNHNGLSPSNMKK